MKILATFKPEWYELPDHSYGVVAEIDWSNKTILRQLRLPSASFRDDTAFQAPLLGGLTQIGNRLFVALWNCIVEIDYATFQVVNAVSHPWMADLHGMTTDGKRLWVVSSAVEAVLCFDAESLTPLWRWGPDQAILEHGAPAWRGWWPLRLFDPRRKAVEREYRYIHKSRSPYRRHHMNDIRFHQGLLYITTHRWFDSKAGAIIRLDPESREAHFHVPPGSFQGMHDGEFRDGRLYVTESAANSVAWREADGRPEHRSLQPAPYFVRGLCQGENDSFLVGFTRLRRSEAPSWIIEYDATFTREISRLDVSCFYPAKQGTAVHALLRSPESPTLETTTCAAS
ncbi:MAG: hypothetical protein HQL56_08585 [Magnetococcales bacterium]|nr:hypothetical protein [Magnetococcales bacterium]